MRRPRLVIQGNLILAQDVAPLRGNPNPPKRGDIQGFSAASRKRMIRDCARLGNSIPVFVTLTYGAEWPPEPSEWKRHLDVWWKRVKRSYPDFSAIWRLEPQERGAPHYHLLVYQSSGKRPFLPHGWVSQTWAEITSGDPSACSRVEALKSHRGGMFYASKYCAKLGDGSLPDGWHSVGKHWGKLSGSMLPFPPQKDVVLHSRLEQRAILSAMAAAYKDSFIRAKVASYEAQGGEDIALAFSIAEHEWKALKEENDFFGYSSTFFGTAEDFIKRVSSTTSALQDTILAHCSEYPKARRTFLKQLDKQLAAV